MKIEYFTRNKTLLADGEGKRIPADSNKVNLNWWHIKYGENKQNLGDMLSQVVYDYMCQYYNLDSERKIHTTKHLYAVGSILFFENQDATVWGTGCTFELQKNLKNLIHQKYMRKLDVRVVRGPYTRNALLKLGIKCPEIYGDPAMLLPLIYSCYEKNEEQILIITHLKDKKQNCDNMYNVS